MKSLLKEISALIFPTFDVVTGDARACCVSGQIEKYLVGDNRCIVCGVPFTKDADSNRSNHSCSRCLAEPPAYDMHRSLFCYESVIRDLVHRFKYDANFWVRQFMGTFMPRLKDQFVAVDGIIPVPLSAKKLCQRGYNQSMLIAQIWASILKKPVWDGILIRVSDTTSQTKLDRGERRKNLRNAFQVVDDNILNKKTILLVDDVHTTGATLTEASLILKQNGVAKVYATTLAIVPQAQKLG